MAFVLHNPVRSTRLTSRNARPACGLRGVTFLELMIVLGILAIMLGIMLPSIKGSMGRNRLSASARELVSIARYARQKAVMLGQATELRIDFENDRFQFRLDPDRRKRRARTSGSDKRTRMERVRHLSDRPGDVYFKRIEVEGTKAGKGKTIKIRFYKNGSAMPAIIVLADRKDRVIQIEFASSTGAVRISDIKIEREKP